ncbi:hypothetical protein BKA62DRAFT_716236 [Auriculariales sp. MPI-PUGE-AT-0066]|nr:hypothetical protein BKA62DRAFT_716236 [Auriculariales sp. MPI-PUGE-AT-0066]
MNTNNLMASGEEGQSSHAMDDVSSNSTHGGLASGHKPNATVPATVNDSPALSDSSGKHGFPQTQGHSGILSDGVRDHHQPARASGSQNRKDPRVSPSLRVSIEDADEQVEDIPRSPSTRIGNPDTDDIEALDFAGFDMDLATLAGLGARGPQIKLLVERLFQAFDISSEQANSADDDEGPAGILKDILNQHQSHPPASTGLDEYDAEADTSGSNKSLPTDLHQPSTASTRPTAQSTDSHKTKDNRRRPHTDRGLNNREFPFKLSYADRYLTPTDSGHENLRLDA